MKKCPSITLHADLLVSVLFNSMPFKAEQIADSKAEGNCAIVTLHDGGQWSFGPLGWLKLDNKPLAYDPDKSNQN